MTRNDRAALKTALALTRNESVGRARQIDAMLKQDGLGKVAATFAAYHCQGRVIAPRPLGKTAVLDG